MINKLQNFMKWVNEQMFKTNPPKEQHMDHMSKLPSGTQVTVTIPQKPKRIIVRKKKDVNNT
jgi:hypothetical protein